ncbi:MAG: ABC transporter permease [Humibacillus sp.]|nr:ABC transporter permease [Humibacillus sp.]MDN5776778.1 ABC transporter permease [Humibacillus sp.]
MLGLAMAQVRNRPARTVALVAGILVATTAFVVLLGASTASRLQATGVVAANARGAYDLLVRPVGAVTPQETTRGLVRSDYLSGTYGGISLAQLGQVRAVAGVEVAAPIALIGVVRQQVRVPVAIPGASLDGPKQLYRLKVTRVTDRGLSRVAGIQTEYTYITPAPLKQWTGPVYDNQPWGSLERQADGKWVIACPNELWPKPRDVFAPQTQSNFDCWSQTGRVPAAPWDFATHDKSITGYILWDQPFLLAAIDPVAEAALVDLPGSVTTGRALTAADRPRPGTLNDSSRLPTLDVPVLLSSKAYTDDVDEVQVEKLGPRAVALMSTGGDSSQRLTALNPLPGQVLSQTRVDSQAALDQLSTVLDRTGGTEVRNYDQPGPVSFTVGSNSALTAQAVPADPRSRLAGKQRGQIEQRRVPLDLKDTWFRKVVNRDHTNRVTVPEPRVTRVGSFDPAKLDLGPVLSRLPTSYEAPPVYGADERSRALLKGQTLAPNENIAGYVQSPPVMLTTMAGITAFTNPRYFPPDQQSTSRVDTNTHPVSAIRVRVAGVTGIDPVSRERVRLVAQRLEALGLRVDITVGSSPTPVRTTLPAGQLGRPGLALAENWTRKGVAVEIIKAVDAKSVALFGLILLVCALTVANAASAAVRARRTELGVLASLGWSPSRLAAMVLAELALIGVLAGAAGAVLSFPVAWVGGLDISPARAALAIPAATGLAILAGIIPAVRAARADPGAAVRPAVAGAGRARPVRGVFSLAVTNLRRVPGRSLLGALSLAVGVAALAVLAGITLAFQGAVAGTLLGDAVTVQVRGVDVAAVVAMVALGIFSVADVVYLNLKERAAEFATLRAIGWGEGPLSRLVAYEGLLIGLVGSLAGAGAGLGVVRLLDVPITPTLQVAVAGAAVVGTLAAAAATLVPTLALRRLPTTEVIAEE